MTGGLIPVGTLDMPVRLCGSLGPCLIRNSSEGHDFRFGSWEVLYTSATGVSFFLFTALAANHLIARDLVHVPESLFPFQVPCICVPTVPAALLPRCPLFQNSLPA